MIAFFICLLSHAASLVCQSEILGDGHCDRACMTQSNGYDQGFDTVSDCDQVCTTHCPARKLSNFQCDIECGTWDCAWDSGDCLLCSGSCLVANLGNGVCDPECDSWSCGWDYGDCSGSDNPVHIYVGTGADQGNGSLETPFNDFTETLMRLFLPYNDVNLLGGTHYLNPNAIDEPVLLSQSGLVETLIQTYGCSDSSCELAVIQATRNFAAFLLSRAVTFSNIRFSGSFDLRQECWLARCLYCPYTVYNTNAKQWINDRNQVIDLGTFGKQADCDPYHEKVFITVTEGASVLFSNVTFERFEQQLKALILNQCGDIRFNNVTFDGNMANPIGLKGGLIQHVCPSAHLPYDCGSIVFEGGNVIYLNDGYEYRPDILFTGFMNIQGIRLLRISNVYFGFSFAMIGYDVDIDLQIHSALIYVTNFREMEVAFCTFEFGIAEISAAIYIDSNFVFPLIVENGEAAEQSLTHLIIRDTNFYNNTSQRGSLLHMSFKGDNINIRLERLTFTSNIALLGVIYIKCATINPEDAKGISKEIGGMAVDFPRRLVTVYNSKAIENYSQALFMLTNVANFEMTDCSFLRNGESPTGVTLFSDVISMFVLLPRPYANIQPYFPVRLICSEIISLSNVLNLTFLFNRLDSSFCPSGVSGLSLSGTVSDVLVHDNTVVNGRGWGALTLALNQPVAFYNLVFRNNTNLANKVSVCLDISMQTPTDVRITDCIFENNRGWYSTVVYAENTISLTMQRVVLVNNTAVYTCAGILFNPLPTGESRLTILDAVFEGNKAKSYGIVTVMDSDGLLSGNTVAKVKIQIANSTFLRNASTNEGASVSISWFINLSPGSVIRNCSFVDNSALSGAAIYATYETGVLHISDSVFLGNTASKGAAIYLSQFYTVDILTEVRISDCKFTNQSQSHAVSIEGFTELNDVYSENNLFVGGEGAYSTTSGRLQDQNSVISLQSTNSGPAFTIQINAIVLVANLTAFHNNARSKGGVFFLTASSFLSVTSSRLFENHAADSGGVAYSDGGSEVAILNSVLSSNSAGVIASAIFVSPGKLTLTNSSVENNTANGYAALMLSRCNATLTSTTFRNNTSRSDSPGIVLSSCAFLSNNSLFEDQRGTSGAFLMAIDHSEIRVESSVFRRGQASYQGGALFGTLQSQFTIVDSTFEDCSSAVEGGAVQLSGCSLRVSNTTFLRTTADSDGGALYVQDGDMVLSGSRFVDTSLGALYLTGVKSVSIAQCQFHRCRNGQGGAIEIRNVGKSLMTGNAFLNNSANRAGAVSFFSEDGMSVASAHSIVGNEFAGNCATEASSGAVLFDSVDFYLAGNRFYNNSAKAEGGFGGAVTVSCGLADWCNVTITRNQFQRNSAEVMGGAIAWTDAYPSMSSNDFSENSAEYGDDIASFPVAIALLTSNSTQTEYIGGFAGMQIALQIKEVASGQELRDIVPFGVFDHLKQLIRNDDRSSAKMTSLNSTALLLYGGLDTKAVSGVFRFSSFTMAAEPGSTQHILVSTNGIDLTQKTKARDPFEYVSTLLIEVVFRMCRSGESLQNNECYLCAAGTYSLDPALPCLLCPSAAVCYGNDTMVPKPGYWRIRNDTDMFIECLAPEACIGSPDPPFLSLIGQCALGYTGNLCQQCTADYSRTGRFQCSRCPSKASNITITTLVMLFALILVALIVWTAINSAMKPQSLIAIYVKIFMNYLQMVVVSAALNLNWPTFAKTFLNGQQMAGGLAEQMFSFECLFQEASISTSRLFFAKLQIYALMPAALFTLAVLAWAAIASCRKVDSLPRKVVASFVIILFILHPSITKVMFSLFACMDLGDQKTWLINDLSIVCWDSDHMKQVLIVVVPSTLVFVFGLPMLSLLYLVCNRIKLDTWGVKLMLCFLYKGYHRQRFYWEFVILYRKVAMIAASVFLAPVSIRVQSLTVLALLLFALFLQVQINPFFDLSLNRLEVKAILVSAITIYSGLYYDTNQLNSSIKISLFVLMVLSNAYFLYSWIRLISPVLIRTLKEKLNRFLCFRRKYRVRAVTSAISDSVDKSNSSIAVFSSNITNPRISVGADLSLDHSRAVHSISYQDPANTSVMPREYSEQDESRGQVHYTFVE